MKGTWVRLAGIAAVVLGAALPGVAWAAEDDPSRFRAIGEVTAVHLEASTFDLHTRAGENLVISVTDDTRFFSREGEIKGLVDIEAGMAAIVRGEVTADGEHVAHSVGIGKPGDHSDRDRFLGSVASIGADNFTIDTRAGDPVTFLVNENTQFHSRDGSVQGLSDLKAGMHVAVGAVKQDDGSLLAVNVFAGPEDRPDRDRFLGSVASIGDTSFTINTRGGESVTFLVNEETQFHSGDGSVQGLGDLKKGMHVAVGAVKQDDGSLLAVNVFAGPEDRPDRPHADVRAAGRIVELGDRDFTIETRDGRRMTFAVTEDTVFKGKAGSFADLEVGMGVGVAAKKTADGSLIAIVVFAGPDRPERDGRPDRSAPEPRTTPEPTPTATPSGDRGD